MITVLMCDQMRVIHIGRQSMVACDPIGALANLERVLLEYVFERVSALDFKPVSVPDLVTKEIAEECGVLHVTETAYSIHCKMRKILSYLAPPKWVFLHC
ncbi:hypothetical protein OSTOST_25419 [Ostertagia ostertagi]